MNYTTSEKAPLLEHLQAMAPDCSKSTLRSWLSHGRIFVDGTAVKIGKQPIDAGASISLGNKQTKSIEGVRILYEDEHIIVIDKPAGLLSVETPFEKYETAHGVLKRHYSSRRIFPVHRLDKDTSGVMVFVSSQVGFDGLKAQFRDHTIQRTYRALVQGHLDPANGTIDTCLREDSNYKMHVVKQSDIRAITHYRTLKQRKKTTLLELVLETGKKNQIRVHLAHLGHPVIGDAKYGNPDTTHRRLALHAHTLSFVHPATLKVKHFQSPNLFEDA